MIQQSLFGDTELDILEGDFKANLEFMRKENNGEIHLGFSGGKDSTVLLNMVRIHKKPEDKVFVNVYAENFFPEIAAFIQKQRKIGEALGETWTIQATGWNIWKVWKEFGWFGNSKFVMRLIGGLKYCMRCKNGEQEFKPRAYKNSKYAHLKKTLDNQIDIYHNTFKAFGLEHIFYDVVNGVRDFPDWNNVRKKQSCCGLIKNSYVKSEKWILTGMRAQEKNRSKIFCKDKNKHRLNILKNWTELNEKQAMEKYGFEICEIYKYLNRTGCMFCAFAGKKSFQFCCDRYADKLTEEQKLILEDMKKAREYFTSRK